jgi:DNA-binding NtrC family response regulator
MLFSPTYGVRVIVLARDMQVARSSLPEEVVVPMLHVGLRPLAYRTVEIDQLMDRRLAEQGSKLRTADLSRENQNALRTYHWPGNLAELRQIADGIAAHATHGSLRAAAKAMARAHQTLAGQFARVGLKLSSD